MRSPLCSPSRTHPQPWAPTPTPTPIPLQHFGETVLSMTSDRVWGAPLRELAQLAEGVLPRSLSALNDSDSESGSGSGSGSSDSQRCSGVSVTATAPQRPVAPATVVSGSAVEVVVLSRVRERGMMRMRQSPRQ